MLWVMGGQLWVMDGMAYRQGWDLVYLGTSACSNAPSNLDDYAMSHALRRIRRHADIEVLPGNAGHFSWDHASTVQHVSHRAVLN